MYESHFGFSGPPFQLNPDPAFYFNSRGHGRALSYLQYGVAQGEGFIVITGEVGAGKTTLVRMLLEGLDRQRVLPAQIVSTQLHAGELLESIITGFGIPAQGSSKAHLIATLEAFLTALAAQGRHALLIVDEAQNLEPRVIEELRMLSNFQLGNKALLQSFLVGQPQLRRSLESPDMEQLRQRVMASYHLGPLPQDETRGYVEHRLRHVGWDGQRPTIDADAYDQLYRWTGGVPRRLNRLCNRALLATFLDGAQRVSAEMVERVAHELRSEIGEGDFEPVELAERAEPPVIEPSTAELLEVATTTEEHTEAPVAATTEVMSEAMPEPKGDVTPPADVAIHHVGPSDDAERVEPEVESSMAGGADDGPLVDEVVDSLMQATPWPELPLMPLERTESLTVRPSTARRPVVLCVAASQAHALQFAALARHASTLPEAPRFVLVNPGVRGDVWPWARMDRLLPALEIGLHLGVVEGRFEQVAPPLFERFGHVIAEFAPGAVITLGDAEVVLACALQAHKRGVPLICADADDIIGGGSAAAERRNGMLLVRLADALVTRSGPTSLTALRREGLPAERIRPHEGDLRTDGLRAVWREVSTAYGAFLRHAMPMYLGPTWSKHAGAGTPFGLVSWPLVAGEPATLDLQVERVLRMARCFASPGGEPLAAGTAPSAKVVWLMDARSQEVLNAYLATRPDLDDDICPVLGDGPRSSALRSKMDRARVLCREVENLPDQLSILLGASWACLAEGQVLLDAARLLGVPALLRVETGLEVVQPTGDNPLASARPVVLGDANAPLAAWMQVAGAQSRLEQPPVREGAVAAIQASLEALLSPPDLQPEAVEPLPVPVDHDQRDRLAA